MRIGNSFPASYRSLPPSERSDTSWTRRRGRSGRLTLPARPRLACAFDLLVPTVRLELTRLSPPPPQDGVSTNFTTSAREKKHHRQHGGRAAQKISRAGRAEHAARRTAAEGGAHVGPFSMLQQHQRHDRDRRPHMDEQENQMHVAPFSCAPCKSPRTRPHQAMRRRSARRRYPASRRALPHSSPSRCLRTEFAAQRPPLRRVG
jgi:hypothetical protein